MIMLPFTRTSPAMISFCAPFTAHLCAAALHRRYPVPWLAYYFDPFFSNETLDPGRAGLRKHLEERTLAEASLVMMTYPTDEDYRSRGIGFGEKIRRAEMPGVVFGESGSPREKRAGDKRICSFFGTLYRDIRNPDPVIRVFSRIGEGMTLRFVGSHEGIHPEDYRAAYPEVEFLGKQSGERLRELYREADVLLNIGNTVLNQMPSKIFEYISTGKPILNVFQSPRCPTLRYLKDYPLALNLAEEELRNRPEESAEKIRRFCLDTAGKTAEEAFLRKRYGANTFESAVEEIGKQLRRIMEPDRK